MIVPILAFVLLHLLRRKDGHLLSSYGYDKSPSGPSIRHCTRHRSSLHLIRKAVGCRPRSSSHRIDRTTVPPSANPQTRKPANQPATSSVLRALWHPRRSCQPAAPCNSCNAPFGNWNSGLVEQWSGAPTRHHLDSHPLGHPLGRPIFHVLTPTHAPPFFLTCITLPHRTLSTPLLSALS